MQELNTSFPHRRPYMFLLVLHQDLRFLARQHILVLLPLVQNDFEFITLHSRQCGHLADQKRLTWVAKSYFLSLTSVDHHISLFFFFFVRLKGNKKFNLNFSRFTFTGSIGQGFDHPSILDYKHDVWERRVSAFPDQPRYLGQNTPFGPPSWIHVDSSHQNKSFYPYLPRTQAVTYPYCIWHMFAWITSSGPSF